MKYSNSIEYNISTKLDKSGITQLKNELAQLELKFQNMGNKNQLFNFDTYRSQIQGLGDALTEAFNPSLGIIDMQKFKISLKENQVTADGLRKAFQAAGSDGQAAFNSLVGQLGSLDVGIKRTSSAVDKMFTTFSNTFRWGLVSSFWSQFLNAIHSSVQYTKELDDSLTQIMLVTDYSRNSMNEYAKAANEAAKAVGQTTVGMTNASLIFAQQGYDINQSQQLATLSAKLANASQQDTAATSDQITAYMNAYGLQNDMEALSQAMDNWARIANISAADVEEIALASQRAASMANAVGVSGEALAAQIATIESVTREAPEQIGNGLKTLYARFSDLKLGKDDEDGIGLGKVTSTLQAIGVQVLDAFGNVRDMDDIMEDLMVVWQDLDDTSKTAAAQALAGKHQVNRFMALMENSNMYQEYLGATGKGASGTLEQMNQEYLESLQGRMAKLQSTLEGLFNDIFTTDMVYPLIDALTKLAEVFDLLFKSVGGGPTVILGLASAFTKLFSNSIASSINDSALNISVQKQRATNFEDRQGILAWLGSVNPNPDNAHSQAILNYAQGINNMAGSFNVEQMNRLNEILKEMVTNANAAEQANNKLKVSLEGLNVVSNALFGTGTESFIDDFGAVNAVNLIDSLNSLTGDKSSNLTSLFDSLRTLESDFTGFSSGLTDVLNKLKQGLNGNEVGSFTEEFTNLETVLARLEKVLPIDQFNKFKYVLEEAKDITENWVSQKLPPTQEQLEAIQLQLNNTTDGLKKFIAENKNLTPQTIVDYLQKTEKAAIAAKAAMSAANGSDEVGLAALQTAINQQRIKSYIDLASAIGQVSFSIQSLKNLYSIWNNDDLSMTDKLLQTFTNLGIVIPNIISALKSATGIKSIKELGSVFSLTSVGDITKINSLMLEHERLLQNVKEAQSNLAKSSMDLEKARKNLYAVAAKENRNDEELLAMSKKVDIARQQEATATKDLKKAEDAAAVSSQKLAAAQAMLNIAILAVVAAVTIAASAISAHMESLKREIKSSGEAFNEAFEKTQVDTSRFDELYEEYKKTGEASDELKEAGEALGEQLDITGAKAYAASGNFNKLAEEINNAKEASEEFAEEQANKVLVNANVASEDYTQWWRMQNFPLMGRGITVNGGPLGPRVTDQLEQYNTNEPTWDEWTNGSALEKYNMALEAINRLEELEAQFNEEGNAFLANAARKRKQNWENIIEDYFSDFPDMIENMAELALSDLSEEDFEGMGTDQIIETLLDPNGDYSWIAAEYELLGAQLGPEAAEKFMDGILSQVSPQEWADKQLESLIEQAQNSRQMIGTYANGTTEYAGGYWDQFNSLLDFGTANNFSSKNIVDVAGLIDWNSPNLDQELANLLERMRASIKGGLSIDDFISIEQAGGAEEYLRNVTSSDESVSNEDLQNASLTLYNNNDSMSQYADDLELVPPLVAEIAEAQLRYNAAVETSTQNMEKWNQTFDDIENHNENLEDVADTMKDLRETYSDFLDLSEDVSDEFISNRKNLERLERAINGDTEAYNELAEAAAEDITLHLGLDEDDVDEAIQTVQDIYDILNSDEYQALKAGDLIDLNSFPDLWPLLQQYVDYLSSLGLSVDEIRQKIMELFHIDIPENAFAGPETAVANSAGKIAGTVDQAVSNIKQNVATVPPTVKHNLSFAQKTKIKSLKSSKKDKVSYTDLKAFTIPHSKEVTYPVGNGDGVEGKTFTATYYDLKYIPITRSVPQIKESTGQSVESEVETGEGASGDVSLMDLGGNPEQFSGEGVRTTSPGGGFTPTGSFSPSSSGGGGGGGGSCFAAGTLISLQDQFKNIEDIQIGDIVLSYNEEIHQNEYSIVLQTMVHDVTEEIYDLYIEDEILTVTGIHRFYIRRKHDIKWISVSDLYIGDYVLFADGNWHPIFKIKVKVRSLLVYNFEVSHNHNYYVGCNQILAHNKGSGGSAKTIEPKEEKKHQKDYYEEVDSQLGKIQEELKGIEKQEDRLIGSKARANQDKQLKLLDKELKLQERKLKILKEQELPDITKALKEQDAAAEKVLSDMSINLKLPDLKFDEDGMVSNYEDVSLAITNAHNALIRKHNEAAKAGNEELAKTIEKAIAKFDEESAALLEGAKNYDKKRQEVIEYENSIKDLADSQEDLKTEIYKTSMEAIDDLKDLEENFADFKGFLTGLNSDSPFRALAKDVTYLNNTFEVSKKDAAKYYDNVIANLQKQLKTADATEKATINRYIKYFNDRKKNLSNNSLNNGVLGLALEDLNQLKRWSEGKDAANNPFGNNAAALKEAYEDAYNRVIELTQEWQDIHEQIVEDIIDGYDEIADKQERQMEEYERLANKMERFSDMYTLAYGEDSYRALSELGKSQGNVLKNQLNQQKAIYNMWVQQYQAAIAAGDEKLANELKDKMYEAEEAMEELAQEAAETFKDAYVNAIKASTQDILKATIGDKDFNTLDRNWEWDKEYIERYRDEVEKAYEVDKLRASYNDLLNDAQGASLATQGKIRKQMEEQLKLLEGQATMSQYDVDLANAKLLVLQKQIALEDAQQNKNQMQLRRDSQGNYRYVYRVNNDDIAKARQEVLDAEYNAYEITKKHAMDTYEQLRDAYERYLKEREEIYEAYNGDLDAAKDDVEALTQRFLRSIMGSSEDASDAAKGLVDVLSWMAENSTEKTGEAAKKMLEQITDAQGNIKDKTEIAWIDAIDFVKDVVEKTPKAVAKANKETTAQMTQLHNRLVGNNGILTSVAKEIAKEGGYKDVIDDTTDSTKLLNQATADVFKTLKNDAKTLRGYFDDVAEYNANLENVISNLKELEATYKKLKELDIEELESENKDQTHTVPTGTGTISAQTGNGGVKGGLISGNSLDKDNIEKIFSILLKDPNSNLSGYNKREQKAGKAFYDAIHDRYEGKYLTAQQYQDELNKILNSYDTGGYTGEWNNNGKLAILHQKELVLNAEDTRNILSAVDIVRQMTSTLGNALTNYSLGGAVGNLMSSALGNIEQRVEIKAEFPNVHDSFEIETALINLSDKAYQYAHRNI